MKIEVFNEFHLGHKVGQVRACEANLGKGTGMFFVYSENGNIDPCEGYMSFNRYPMEIAMFGEMGNMLWHKELGIGTVTGTWFVPFVAADINCDGVDEIWLVCNSDTQHPLNTKGFELVQINALTGEEINKTHFKAENTEWQRFGHAYRFMIFSGFDGEKPVMIAAQGTYGDIFLQAYDKNMNICWERKIDENDGSLGSHSAFVFDFNNDGVDEVLYGEHLVSLKNGEDILCFGGDAYHGHSDIVLPFTDKNNDKMYLFTGRESGDYNGCPRVVVFDFESGKEVWKDIYSDEWGDYIDDGHIHYGWVANLKGYNQKVAFVHRQRAKKKIWELHTYNAVTGEKINIDFPYPLNNLRPIDINGDGFHEFVFWQEAYPNASIITDNGEKIFDTNGILIHIGKHYHYQGEQIMVWYPDGKVRIYGDADASDNEVFKKRYKTGFLKKSLKSKGTGYNWLVSVDCAF